MSSPRAFSGDPNEPLSVDARLKYGEMQRAFLDLTPRRNKAAPSPFPRCIDRGGKGVPGRIFPRRGLGHSLILFARRRLISGESVLRNR